MNDGGEAFIRFGAERYSDNLPKVFAYACQQLGWPKGTYRRWLRFFRNEATPEYWLGLPPEESAMQVLQWIIAENPDAPVSDWAGMDVISQARAAGAWLDRKEA